MLTVVVLRSWVWSCFWNSGGRRRRRRRRRRRWRWRWERRWCHLLSLWPSHSSCRNRNKPMIWSEAWNTWSPTGKFIGVICYGTHVCVSVCLSVTDQCAVLVTVHCGVSHKLPNPARCSTVGGSMITKQWHHINPDHTCRKLWERPYWWGIQCLSCSTHPTFAGVKKKEEGEEGEEVVWQRQQWWTNLLNFLIPTLQHQNTQLEGGMYHWLHHSCINNSSTSHHCTIVPLW